MSDGIGGKIEELRKFSTPNVSDALDKLGIIGQAYGIKPLQFGFKAAGPVFTVKFLPAGLVKAGAGDFLDDVPAGSIVVIDNEGRTDCTTWGDIMTKLAIRNKLAGTIINGVCRDVDVILELKYPMFSKDYYMRTGKDRAVLSAVQIPISVGGVMVSPGDIAVADENGVVFFPTGKLDEVLGLIRTINGAEEKIEKALSDGMRLDEARKINKYDELNRKLA
jgi:regulator of RNase E activity RraA